MALVRSDPAFCSKDESAPSAFPSNSDRLASVRVAIGTISHIKMGTSPMVAIACIVSE